MNLNKTKNRAFTNMLTTTLKNHYTLNQMVDRKARIILTVNMLLLSFIISKIIGNQIIYDLKLFVLIAGSIFCLISIVYSVLAIIPENDKNDLDTEKLKKGTLNPLYFGNYLSMKSESYENAMMEMSDDFEFSHRALLKDIYHIGVVLNRKRKLLKYAVIAMTIGVCIMLILSVIFRIVTIN